MNGPFLFMASWNFSKMAWRAAMPVVEAACLARAATAVALPRRRRRPPGAQADEVARGELEVVARVRVVRAPEPEPERFGAGPVGLQADLDRLRAGA